MLAAILFALGFFSDIRAQVADIHRLRSDFSSFLALPRYNDTQKAVTRDKIRTEFDDMGIKGVTQTFINEETDELGWNIFAIQPGTRYGTPEDRITVLTANYDTSNEITAGVGDNGSGVSAVLETARILTGLDAVYGRTYTIIYALFDMKHQAFAGSHAFVEEILLPIISRTNSTISGVIVLDGVMHFDPFPTTQAIPDHFEELFPGAYREISDHGSMGNFIEVIGREKYDTVIVQSFISGYMRSVAKLEADWSFKPWILPLSIDIQQFSSISDLYKLRPYLFADHSSFYFHSNQDIDIPTLYVTDTQTLRGVRQYCPHCDGLYMLSDKNLQFLALITDSVIRTVIHMANSDAIAILDELHIPIAE